MPHDRLAAPGAVGCAAPSTSNGGSASAPAAPLSAAEVDAQAQQAAQQRLNQEAVRQRADEILADDRATQNTRFVTIQRFGDATVCSLTVSGHDATITFTGLDSKSVVSDCVHQMYQNAGAGARRRPNLPNTKIVCLRQWQNGVMMRVRDDGAMSIGTALCANPSRCLPA